MAFLSGQVALIIAKERPEWKLSGRSDLFAGESNDANVGKAMSVMVVTYLDREGTFELGGKIVDDEEAAKANWNWSLNGTQLALIKEKWSEWASWFGDLPKDEQEALMRAIRKRGMLAVAVYEGDPALEAMLQKHPLDGKPVGFLPWSVKPETVYLPDFGEWIYP